jgi:hypothetical protein
VGADFELQDHRIAIQSMKSKAGWRKIQFCGDQAARDGLDYFWSIVDALGMLPRRQCPTKVEVVAAEIDGH